MGKMIRVEVQCFQVPQLFKQLGLLHITKASPSSID